MCKITIERALCKCTRVVVQQCLTYRSKKGSSSVYFYPEVGLSTLRSINIYISLLNKQALALSHMFHSCM